MDMKDFFRLELVQAQHPRIVFGLVCVPPLQQVHTQMTNIPDNQDEDEEADPDMPALEWNSGMPTLERDPETTDEDVENLAVGTRPRDDR